MRISAADQSVESGQRNCLREHRDFIINTAPEVLDSVISTDNYTAEEAKRVEWSVSAALRKRLENKLPGLIICNYSFDAEHHYFVATIHWKPFVLPGYPLDEHIDERAECEVHFRKNLTGPDRVQWVWKTANFQNL